MASFKSILENLNASKATNAKNPGENAVRIQPLSSMASTSSYSINDLIVTNPEYKRIFGILRTSKDYLELGYSLATSAYKSFKSERSINDYKTVMYAINEHTISIDKIYSNDGDIPVDMITPARFSGILAYAAYDSVIRAWKDEEMLNSLLTVTNPFGASHGFLIQKPDKWTEDEKIMLLAYLTTTSGFDHLTPRRPELIAAVCMWRGLDNHPKLMKIDKDLDEGADDYNDQLQMRIYQNSGSKVFQLNEHDVKLAEAVNDAGFMAQVDALFRILITHSQTPSSAKVGRVATVAKSLQALAQMIVSDQASKPTAKRAETTHEKAVLRLTKYQEFYDAYALAYDEAIKSGRDVTSAQKQAEAIAATAMNAMEEPDEDLFNSADEFSTDYVYAEVNREAMNRSGPELRPYVYMRKHTENEALLEAQRSKPVKHDWYDEPAGAESTAAEAARLGLSLNAKAKEAFKTARKPKGGK